MPLVANWPWHCFILMSPITGLLLLHNDGLSLWWLTAQILLLLLDDRKWSFKVWWRGDFSLTPTAATKAGMSILRDFLSLVPHFCYGHCLTAEWWLTLSGCSCCFMFPSLISGDGDLEPNVWFLMVYWFSPPFLLLFQSNWGIGMFGFLLLLLMTC